jgi:hypothetical protein
MAEAFVTTFNPIRFPTPEPRSRASITGSNTRIPGWAIAHRMHHFNRPRVRCNGIISNP